jgi:signal transduction histidine kinase/CheY-like chemotaxis protein
VSALLRNNVAATSINITEDGLYADVTDFSGISTAAANAPRLQTLILACGLSMTCLLAASAWLVLDLHIRAKKTASRAAADAHEQTLAFAWHELRNPLHVVSASAGLLLDALPTDSPAHDDAEAIATAANQLHRLINSMLDLVALRQGRMAIGPGVFAVRPLIRRIAAAHRSFAPVPISFRVDPAVPQWILSDDLRVQQILQNGLTNACKLCNQGEISVEVSVLREAATDAATADPRKVMLRFDLTDTGPGLSRPAELLFEPFITGNNAGQGGSFAALQLTAGDATPRPLPSPSVSLQQPNPLKQLVSPAATTSQVSQPLPQLSPKKQASDTSVVFSSHIALAVDSPAPAASAAEPLPDTPAPPATPTALNRSLSASKWNWQVRHRAGSFARPSSTSRAPSNSNSGRRGTAGSGVGAGLGFAGSAAARARGAGLGLPVSRLLAETLGGSLTLFRDTERNVTVFRLELPLVCPQAETLTQQRITELLAEASGSSKVANGAPVAVYAMLAAPFNQSFQGRIAPMAEAERARPESRSLRTATPDTSAIASRATVNSATAASAAASFARATKMQRRSPSNASRTVGGGGVALTLRLDPSISTRDQPAIAAGGSEGQGADQTERGEAVQESPATNDTFSLPPVPVSTPSPASPRFVAAGRARAQTAASLSCLPAALPASLPAASAVEATDKRTAFPPLQLHLLIVEDERVNQKIVSRLLHKVGCTCVVVDDGDQLEPALRTAGNLPPEVGAAMPQVAPGTRRFDAVLLDILMARLQGDEACKLARNAGATLPIFATTGTGFSGLLAAGFTAVVAKPFDAGQLYEVLKDVKPLSI